MSSTDTEGTDSPLVDSPALGPDVLRNIDSQLAWTDELLRTGYPGDRDVRQAVHTVYMPADAFHDDVTDDWGRRALAAVDDHGGMAQLAERVIRSARTEGNAPGDGPDPAAREIRGEAEDLAAAVTEKLAAEPIEDLRLDFEDGFGTRSDQDEDHWASEAAHGLARTREQGTAPPFIGIRFKSLEEDTRRRGLRTLEIFLGALLDSVPRLPEGLVLTLPKVSTAEQIRAMVSAAEALERGYGLVEGRIGFEVQVETPQLILGPDGRSPVAEAVHAGQGRITSLHYGTYDYSASLGIAPAHQAMDHPAADFAKHQMQLAVAGTGVHLSDGSTNILPVGEPDQVLQAWELHARLVRRHLQRGIYQGWDLHPHQLATRFLATFHFFREGFPAAAARLKAYVYGEETGVLDEPATARALAGYLQRGLVCGALSQREVRDSADVDASTLRTLARTGAAGEPQS